jgi:hypothetical protein
MKVIGILVKIFIPLSGIAVLSLGYLVYIFETSLYTTLSKEQQEWLFKSIEETPELPDNFYKVLEKHYPDFFTVSVWHSVFDQVLFHEKNRCQYRDLYLPSLYINKKQGWIPYHKTDLVIALALEKSFSQKKCYAFNMATADFGMNTRDITKAARFYYKKDLNELTEPEILALNIIKNAPSYYSPILNPDRLNKAVQSLMK